MAVDAYLYLRADALPENIADDAARRAVLAMLKEDSDRREFHSSGRLRGRSKSITEVTANLLISRWKNIDKTICCSYKI